jgi:hypothetical protein
MVHGGEGPLGELHLQAALAQHGKGLRGGHLVDEMQPDEELVLARSQLAYGMLIEDLVKKILSHLPISLST